MKYEAWSIYKFDEPKDNYGNLKIQQYGSGYDFKLEDQLKPYNIKEPENPKRFSEVVNSLKDGERQSVTAISTKGAVQNLLIEAVLCYGTIIFFTPKGQTPDQGVLFERRYSNGKCFQQEAGTQSSCPGNAKRGNCA